MTTSSKQEDEKRIQQHKGDGSILPLAVRQRLWDQIWTRLFAPPVDAGDSAPVPKQGDRREGGQR